MGFSPITTYPPYQPYQPKLLAQSGAPVSKTPVYSLNAAAGALATNAPGKDPQTHKPLPSGMTIVQTGGDGEEKAVPIADLLVDPITRKKFDIDTPFTDRQLELNFPQKVKMSLEHNFVTMPKTIVQGLKGDNRFTFSDFLDVANIPYYLGGAVLAGSFAAGGDRPNMIRQGIGVGLYYAGILGANQAINLFYKLKSGVDLNLKYRKPNGDIEKVLASADFPRVDLLTKPQRAVIARKTGIPTNVADPDREVNDQVRQIISAARADKLILGNLAAAIVAGYVARTELWWRALNKDGQPDPVFKAIWKPKIQSASDVMSRLNDTRKQLWSNLEPAITRVFCGGPGESNPWLRRSLLGGLGVGTGMILWHSWKTVDRDKRPYQSPFLSNMSPQLAPEMSPETAAIQRNLPGGDIPKLINKQTIFNTVRNVEVRTQEEAANESPGQAL